MRDIKQLFLEQDGLCWWCGNQMVLLEHIGGPKPSVPKNLATRDHLLDRDSFPHQKSPPVMSVTTDDPTKETCVCSKNIRRISENDQEYSGILFTDDVHEERVISDDSRCHEIVDAAVALFRRRTGQ